VIYLKERYLDNRTVYNHSEHFKVVRISIKYERYTKEVVDFITENSFSNASNNPNRLIVERS
jgi:tryptophanase